METNNPQKQAARNLFLHSDRTRAEIADLIDINTKTLYLWIKHGRWEEMKASVRQTPSSLLQDVYDHIEAINNKIKSREDRCPTYQEVEMLRKLFATTKHVQKLNLGTYVEAFTELTSFIHDHDRELGKKVVTLTDQYIKGLVKPKSAECVSNASEVSRKLKEMKEQEEKEIAELPQAETPVEEINKSDSNTAIIIPLPHNHEDESKNGTPEQPTSHHAPDLKEPSQYIPARTHKILKSTPSFFARPPRKHHIPALFYKVIGHHRAFFHYIKHSKSINNPNSMPDENFLQTVHDETMPNVGS